MVLFAGLLTIVLLKRRLHIHHWLGMALIVAGAAIVGASSVIFDSNKRPRMEQPFEGTRRLQVLEARLECVNTGCCCQKVRDCEGRSNQHVTPRLPLTGCWMGRAPATTRLW